MTVRNAIMIFALAAAAAAPRGLFAYTECLSDADCSGTQCRPAVEAVCAGYHDRVASECSRHSGLCTSGGAFALDGITFQADNCALKNDACAINETRFNAYCKNFFESNDRYAGKKFCSESAGSHAAASPAPPALRFTPTEPKLQIPIPNAPAFSKVELQGPEGGKFLLIPWIGQYLAAIYRYGISIVGVIATVMIMVGGARWLTAAGDSGKITQAKENIRNAAIGLIIAFGATAILYVINPELLKFRSLKISFVTPAVFQESEPPQIESPTAGLPPGTKNSCYLAAYGRSDNEVRGNLVEVRFIGQSLKLHRLAAEDFQAALNELEAAGDPATPIGRWMQYLRGEPWYDGRCTPRSGYPDGASAFGGAWVGRLDDRLSAGKDLSGDLHAFGLAVDLDPCHNLSCRDCALATNIPPEVVALFARHNIYWGGLGWGGRASGGDPNFVGYHDPMHFEWRGGACATYR